jgi:hypothetical protein
VRPVIRRKPGVLVFEDIPVEAQVHARVDRPTELNEASDGGQAAAPASLAPYRFERAPLPAAFTVGGVSFRSRTRVLNVVGGASIQEAQHVPAYAPFAPTQNGSLVQTGRESHPIPMPGGAVKDADRPLLRFRWPGTAIAGATLIAAAGGETVLEPNAAAPPLWPSGHENLVPGSIVITLTGGAGTLRDDGAGRLVGTGGDGQVDYQTGAWHIDLDAAAVAGNVLVNYEHGCLYLPLDVFLEWDSLLR